jgi:hypothetical protein
VVPLDADPDRAEQFIQRQADVLPTRGLMWV